MRDFVKHQHFSRHSQYSQYSLGIELTAIPTCPEDEIDRGRQQPCPCMPHDLRQSQRFTASRARPRDIPIDRAMMTQASSSARARPGTQQILIKGRRRERSQETVTASTAPQDEFILPSRNASRWREQNASCNDRRHGTESTAPHEGLSRLVELDRRDKHPWRRSSNAHSRTDHHP